ncbi:hypothetical protein, partial [Burkholderia cenocepacia]|uniref:hypothetical protein n=1 Tax=Burkholderia cenocepacia TaxID=95486 RepID=UPI0022370B70
EFRVQVQALARFNRHFFLAFAWHNVAPWPSVYASHTKVRIGSELLQGRDPTLLSLLEPLFPSLLRPGLRIPANVITHFGGS